jgi:hypothetical protein
VADAGLADAQEKGDEKRMSQVLNVLLLSLIALDHFQARPDEFQELGLPANAGIARGDPATVIAKAAERLAADMLL